MRATVRGREVTEVIEYRYSDITLMTWVKVMVAGWGLPYWVADDEITIEEN